jgi:hypothetical protein
MAKSAHAKAVYRQVAQQMGKSNNPEEVIWAVIDTVGAILDGVNSIPIVGPVANVAKIIKTAADGSGADSLIDNPYFIGNGQGEDDPSAYTKKYMKNRMAKNIAAGGASIAGAVGSVWTAVDVAGIAMHGNATGTTAAHLAVYADMAKKVRKGGTLAQWLDILIKMKSLKLTVRGTSLVGSAVPVPAVGITTGVIAAAVATGTKLTLSKACVATAVELHWRTWQEQFMSGVFGGGRGKSVGPASAMVYELFAKRGITRVLGKYDIDQLVKEPAGWHAICDKLLLI